MQINLRKASAILKEINNVIAAEPLATTITINEYTDYGVARAAAQQTLINNAAKHVALYKVEAYIRNEVARANVASGVASTLTLIARFDKEIKELIPVASALLASLPEHISDKQHRMKEKTTDSYYAESVITSGFLYYDQKDMFINKLNKLKKEKRSLQDKLLDLNIKSEITLSDADVRTLEDSNIL
jgi:SMC interacting uncharacterized protein involved in chromosome segregation